MAGRESSWLIPSLEGYRLNWLANAEISASPSSQDRVGLSLYQYDRYEFAECAKQLPSYAVELDQELRKRFELDPRRWTKLGFLAGRRQSLSQYFVVDPRNTYPIATLRLGLRMLSQRAGCALDTSLIEPGFAHALGTEGTLWALIAKWSGDRPLPRISCMIQLELLESTLSSLVNVKLLSDNIGKRYLEIANQFPSSPHVFVSADPCKCDSVLLDFEPVDDSEIPASCQELWNQPQSRSRGKKYLKCRLSDEVLEPIWTVYRPLPEVMSCEMLSELTASPPATAGQTRQYYDAHNSEIVRALGSTYQAGLIGKSGNSNQTLSNLASACGVKAGETVLDMGCGTGGPAIALAQSAEDIIVIGLTISSQQAKSAEEHIEASPARDQVAVFVGDFHQCPLGNESVDRVVFFESLGYAQDMSIVLREAYRCLRPGGEIYIKDVVRKPDELSGAEMLELAEFDRLYAQRTPTPEAIARALVVSGFTDLKFEPLSKVMTVTGFFAAMFDPKSPDGLSDFGRYHYRAFRQLPVTFAHFSAKKQQLPSR